jgi:hypothetical protein
MRLGCSLIHCKEHFIWGNINHFLMKHYFGWAWSIDSMTRKTWCLPHFGHFESMQLHQFKGTKPIRLKTISEQRFGRSTKFTTCSGIDYMFQHINHYTKDRSGNINWRWRKSGCHIIYSLCTSYRRIKW